MTEVSRMEVTQKAYEQSPRRRRFKSKLIDWFLVPVLGGLIIGYFTCTDCIVNGAYEAYLASSIVSAAFWLTLAEGNAYLGCQIDKHVSWLHEPVKRSIVGVVVLLVYTTLASLVILFIFIQFYLKRDFVEVFIDNWQFSLRLPILITIFIALILNGRDFLLSWRQTAINLEKAKSENIASQYESLKNQVNPHFLFNSLNALSSLVYSDQEKAVEFIRKLSEVYRYVLDHQMDEAVDINEEIKFVESFVYLNRIRFGENLNVVLSGFEDLNGQYMIPPLAIQMLLENCLKHNIVSKDNRLTIEIYLKDENLVVKNNLNPKKHNEHSSGLGLKNIKSRYSFLTEKHVDILQDDSSFTVKLPLLKKSVS